MKTVLVLLPVREEHKQILERAGEGCRFVYERFKTVTEEQVQQAQIIIGCADPGQIHGSERLEWLQLHSAGADPYLVPGVLGPKTVLTNATGAYGKAVSEHAMALTLMMQKKLYLYRDNQRKNSWHDEGKVSSPSSSTVLVMGLGDIGLSYARKMKALGATVIGVKRRQAVCPEGVDELVTTEQLDEVLPRADVVASFLPGNGQTRHIFNAERFGRMKPGPRRPRRRSGPAQGPAGGAPGLRCGGRDGNRASAGGQPPVAAGEPGDHASRGWLAPPAGDPGSGGGDLSGQSEGLSARRDAAECGGFCHRIPEINTICGVSRKKFW